MLEAPAAAAVVAAIALTAALVLAAESITAYGSPLAFARDSANVGCLTPEKSGANGPRNKSFKELRAAFA
jgi:hypothetical protein